MKDLIQETKANVKQRMSFFLWLAKTSWQAPNDQAHFRRVHRHRQAGLSGIRLMKP